VLIVQNNPAKAEADLVKGRASPSCGRLVAPWSVRPRRRSLCSGARPLELRPRRGLTQVHQDPTSCYLTWSSAFGLAPSYAGSAEL
jgi:hypothetical protein